MYSNQPSQTLFASSFLKLILRTLVSCFSRALTATLCQAFPSVYLLLALASALFMSSFCKLLPQSLYHEFLLQSLLRAQAYMPPYYELFLRALAPITCGVLDYFSGCHHVLGSYIYYIVYCFSNLLKLVAHLIFFAILGKGKTVIRGESSRTTVQG